MYSFTVIKYNASLIHVIGKFSTFTGLRAYKRGDISTRSRNNAIDKRNSLSNIWHVSNKRSLSHSLSLSSLNVSTLYNTLLKITIIKLKILNKMNCAPNARIKKKKFIVN